MHYYTLNNDIYFGPHFSKLFGKSGHPTWVHTLHIVILRIWSHSEFGHTLYLDTLCIWTHSVFGHILYLVTFCIWSHSVFGHILEDTIIHQKSLNWLGWAKQ